jgi:hypothetical protein
MLITVRPGPELCVWKNGSLVCAIPLDLNTVLCIIEDLIKHTPRSPK